MTKQDLHRMIDQLPESAVAKVAQILEDLQDSDEALPAVFRDAPEDDEPLTPEELQAIQEAREDVLAGRIISNEELRRELGW